MKLVIFDLAGTLLPSSAPAAMLKAAQGFNISIDPGDLRHTTLEKIGNGKLEKERIVEALCNPDKMVDFGLAPARPLILKDIVYDFDFKYNKELLIKLDELKKIILNKIII